MTNSPIATKTPASTMSVTEAAATLGIGRTLAYELARTGELPTIRPPPRRTPTRAPTTTRKRLNIAGRHDSAADATGRWPR